jgi:hypothetical protein
MGIGPWFLVHSCVTSNKSLVRGYCTLFLINIDLWSRGGLPIDLSPWSMDQGSLMECIFVYLQKKIVFNLVMEQNKEQRQIELIEIRANFRKLHQIIRKLL